MCTTEQLFTQFNTPNYDNVVLCSVRYYSCVSIDEESDHNCGCCGQRDVGIHVVRGICLHRRPVEAEEQQE